MHVNIQRDISATFLDICKWTCSIASGKLGSGLLNPFAVLSFLSSVSPCCYLLEFLNHTIHKYSAFVSKKMILFKPSLITSTAFTSKAHTIGAPIAGFTMPLSPIPAGTTLLAMPGAAVLNNFVPTKRVPVDLPTF